MPRDSAKLESEELMNSLLPTAHTMLSKYGEFYPFGGFTSLDGQIRHVGVRDDTTEHPEAENMIATLESMLSDQVSERKCKATAIVCDVRVRLPGRDNKSDAIQVRLEHIEGYSVEVFFPYEIRSGQLQFGESFANEVENKVFKGHGLQ